MKNISDFAGQSLLIIQPSLRKRYYELKHDSELIGKFSFPKTFSSKLNVEMQNGKWEIYQPSFWNSLVLIKEAGEYSPIAKYKRHGLKQFGILNLPEENQLKIMFKMLRTGYEIHTLAGENLLSCKEMYSLKNKSRIFIKKRSVLIDRYPWVIVLLWYLAYRRKHSAAAH